MTRTLGTAAAVVLAGALAMSGSPASAQSITLPFIGDLAHPDLDPIHILNPEPPPTPAAAPAEKPMTKHHHHHKMMMKKKKMTEKKM